MAPEVEFMMTSLAAYYASPVRHVLTAPGKSATVQMITVIQSHCTVISKGDEHQR